MKLNYSILISPYPFYLNGVGHIKSPTLREIWSPDITYSKYLAYTSMLLMDIQMFFERTNQKPPDWYEQLSEDEKKEINLFDVIAKEPVLQNDYQDILGFFFVENILWDDQHKVFLTYLETNENGQVIPIGVIGKQIWIELCDVILQRCAISRSDADSVDESKVKSNRVLEILKKIKKGKRELSKSNKFDKDTELPNIISKVAVMAKSINYTNIWDMTVFQVTEQFRQECANVWFDIHKTSVAAYGNEKKTFKGNEWYKTDN